MKNLLKLSLILLSAFAIKPFFAQSTRNIQLHISGDQLYPSWSKDGQKLIYQSNQNGNWDLFLYDFKTGQTRELTHSKTDEQHPVWVSGKQAIIFETGHGKNSHLYLLKINGGKEKLLIPRKIPSREASLTPSHRMVAFSGWDDISQNWQIYTYDFIYNNLNQLSQGKKDATFPVFTPNGKTIAYRSRSSYEISKLHLINWYGANNRILPVNSKGRITWTPSGWRFYGIHHDQGSDYKIYSWHSDGSGRKVILQSKPVICCPAISPGGKHLAFSQQTAHGFDIFIIPVKEY